MKRLPVVGAAIGIIAGGVLLWLVTREPSTPEDQLSYAEDLLTDFVKEKDLTPEEAMRRQEEILQEFREVFERFPQGPKAPDARRRIAELREKWNDLPGALEECKSFVEKHADHPAAEEMLWHAAELAERKLSNSDGAMELYAKFLEKFPQSTRCEEAAWRIIQIKVSLGEDRFALGDLLDALRKFLEAYPEGEREAEARLALGDTLYRAKEYQAAVREFDRVIEDFEGEPAAARALEKKGEILSKDLNRKKEAKETFERLEREFPETPEGRRGGSKGRDLEDDVEGEEAKKREEEYFKERYGRRGQDFLDSLRVQAPVQFVKDILNQKIEIEHVALDVTIRPEKGALEAVCELVAENRGAEHRSILFLAMPGMKVVAANVDGKEAKVAQSGDRLAVTPAAPIPAGAKFRVEFVYAISGVPEQGLIRIAETGFAAPGAIWYPFTVFGNLVDGEATYHLPAELTVIGSGSLKEEHKENGYRVSTWKLDKPAFGLFFAYGSFATAQAGPVSVLALDAERAKSIAEQSTEILDFYSSKFGALPFPAVRIVETDLPDWAGGVSPATLVLLNQKTAEAKLPVSLLAHELAHQWWGNLVPVTFRNEGYVPWLSEGLATYSDALFLEHKFGVERMSQHLQKGNLLYLERTLKLPDDAIARCWSNHPEYFAVVYMKGASIFGSLRQEVGDEAFFRALRGYASQFAFQESGIGDLQKVFEKESGRDLKVFFLQWVHAPGFPHFKIESVAVAPDGGRFRATVKLRQTQPPFSVPLEVGFYGAEQSAFAIVPVSKEETSMEQILPFEPVRIVLDPNNRVLKHPGDDNTWTKP